MSADPFTLAVIKLVAAVAISWILKPDPPKKGVQQQPEAQGVLVNKASNNTAIPVVYGRRQVGVARVYVENSGSDNTYLYMATVISEGGGYGIEDIEDIYINDKRVNWDGLLTDGTQRSVHSSDPNFYKSGSLITVQSFYGKDDQVASTLLKENTLWTDNHKLSGVAYLAFKFKWNQDAFNSLPEVKVVIKGVKVYDPRLDSTKGGSGSHRQDTASTWAYSDNSALCLLDYLRNSRYGKGLPNSAFESNYDTFKSSANTCETQVPPYTNLLTDSVGLYGQKYEDYFRDSLDFFNGIKEIVNSTVTKTYTAITNLSCEKNTSFRFKGYFRPSATGTYYFRTTSSDSSLVYLGTAGQKLSTFITTLQDAPSFTDGTISSYLKVNNSGTHTAAAPYSYEEFSEQTGEMVTYYVDPAETTVTSSGISLVANTEYPIVIYHGNADSYEEMLFEYSTNGTTWVSNLSTLFNDGQGDSIDNIDLFTTNIVIDTEQKVIDNVRELLNPMRAIFTYTEGKYFLIIEDAASSVMTLNKDNIIGGIKIYGEKKNTKYNRVVGTFVNPDKEWQEDTVSFPPADDSGLPVEDRHATLLSEDNGTLLEGSFTFGGITNPYQAEELCEIVLRRSRNALSVEVQVTSEALNLKIGDLIALTYETGGFSSKLFRIFGLVINTDSTVSLKLIEHQDAFYSWSSKGKAPIIADTTKPKPNIVQPPTAVTLSDQLIQYNDGTVIVALDILIGASPDSFVDYYQIEYKLDSATDWIIFGQGSGLNHRILNVIDQETYDVRVKAVNAIGSSSDYVEATRTIIGGTAPPSDVEDFACNIIGGDAHLSWTAIPDLDLGHYQIRYSTLTTGAEWQNSVSLVEKVSRPATSITVPARVGSYLIKAIDKLGNYSSNETIISTTVASIGNYTSITSLTESPSFTGTAYNVIASDGTLRLDSSELFDSATGTFDSLTTRLFDSGAVNYDLYSEGYYDFANVIDLGATYTVRVTASLTQTADNLDDIFDNRIGNFDDQYSNFDGDTPANCDAHLEIGTSTDNITYTGYRNFVVGDYTGRYFRFRVVLRSKDLSSTPVISYLSASVDAIDRIFSGNDISSGVGTYTVSFTNAFYSANYAIGITAQSLGTGNYYDITSKTISGFGITFRNSSGTAISKTFDYIVKGY